MRSLAELGFCWLLFLPPVSLGRPYCSPPSCGPYRCAHQLWLWTQQKAPPRLQMLSCHIRLLFKSLPSPCSVASSLLKNLLTIVRQFLG